MNPYLIQKLKEGRITKGYKQSDVTKLTGIKNTTLSNYENGVTEPDIDTFLQLCELYDLDYAEILGEAYGLNVQGSDFDIKPSEIDKIKKYRTLDEHGKDMVNVVLEKEFDRCQAVVNGPVVINIGSKAHGGDGYYLFSETDMPEHLLPKAAHERTDLDHEITDEDRQADLEILKQMKNGK